MLSKGHRRIAFINSTESSPSSIGRLRGYKEALKAHGIAFDAHLVLKAEPEQDGGYVAASRLLFMTEMPSAVFCYNDRVAMGLYDRVKEAGRKIPSDVAVVGFDDQEVIAAHLRPALSSVALPHYDIGVQAVKTLLDMTGSGRVTPGAQHVYCPLVLRDST